MRLEWLIKTNRIYIWYKYYIRRTVKIMRMVKRKQCHLHWKRGSLNYIMTKYGTKGREVH